MLENWGLTRELANLFKTTPTGACCPEALLPGDRHRDAPLFLVPASESSSPEAPETAGNRRSHMLEEMQQLLAYMDTHYGEDITLSFAAEKMNFSESYFSRVFKRLMGINFVTYLNMIRVEHAAAELKASGKRVLDIALSSGFNNIRTFNRVFKEITGYTPASSQHG